MLVSWIIVEILGKGRETFLATQPTWSGLKTAAGFVARTGGWVEDSPQQAVFLEFWRDTGSYNRFRETQSEALPAVPGQSDGKVSVWLGNLIMTVNERDPARLIPSATFLRLTDCTLKPRRSPIFMAAQLQIWNPAMGSAEGMLGAMVSRLNRDLERFAIASFWRDRRCHEQYEQEIFPVLYKQGHASESLAEIAVYRVPLEKGWRIIAGV